jgi:glycosyltransferase involved in cell wall biosynthesis
MNMSFVIPLYNEEESLEELTARINDTMQAHGGSYEILYVNDGSTDGSMDVLRRLQRQDPERLRVISFRRNYGKSAGLREGIARARGEIIATMDADLQDDPCCVPDMAAMLDQGWDMVSGWKKKRHDPITKTLPSKLFNGVTGMVTGLRLHDFNCGLKVYKASVAKELEIYGERHRYLPVLAHWNGARVTETEVTHHARKYGVTKYGVNRFWRGFFDLLTLVFLRKYLRSPLYFFGILGVLFCLVGGGILGYFGIQWLITMRMHIRPLILFAVGSVIMGIQFFSIGLIGEMITNISAQRYSVTISEEIDTTGHGTGAS